MPGPGRYIIGESYAGVYVPTLVRAIRADATFPGNLRGFAVGDGCLGGDAGRGPYFDVECARARGPRCRAASELPTMP